MANCPVCGKLFCHRCYDIDYAREELDRAAAWLLAVYTEEPMPKLVERLMELVQQKIAMEMLTHETENLGLYE